MKDVELEENLKNILSGINEKVDLNIKREDTPSSLKIKLLEHQKIGLSWMLKMEKSKMKGGLLSDDMGLGKTIQTLACIVKQKKEWHIPCRTLIVAPLALIYQWLAEIEDKVNKNTLRCYVYHGSNKEKCRKKLKNYDIVLTTYNTLTQDYKSYTREVAGDVENLKSKSKKIESKTKDKEDSDSEKKEVYSPLLSTKWNRVVLDESHYIKNRQTSAAKACFVLESTYRWCLSGNHLSLLT